MLGCQQSVRLWPHGGDRGLPAPTPGHRAECDGRGRSGVSGMASSDPPDDQTIEVDVDARNHVGIKIATVILMNHGHCIADSEKMPKSRIRGSRFCPLFFFFLHFFRWSRPGRAAPRRVMRGNTNSALTGLTHPTAHSALASNRPRRGRQVRRLVWRVTHIHA